MTNDGRQQVRLNIIQDVRLLDMLQTSVIYKLSLLRCYLYLGRRFQPIVDDFSSTVSSLNFDMCVISIRD